MPLDPNAPPVQTPPPGMGAPQTQSAPMPDQIASQPMQAAPTPAQAQIAKNLKTGLGFHALMGTHTDYQQGPNGPVPVQQPNNAKQLFRSILSGAILGMAGGAQGANQDAGSGWAAAARGAGAARQGQIQDQQRQQQAAQQQFENSQKAQSAATEDQLRKAQISMYNMQKLKDLQEIQGGDYTSHQRMVSDAKPIVESYQATGLTPVVENISEADHEQYLKDHPGSGSLDWQPTGMTHYVDKDGRVNYQIQVSAYDPKGSVVVPSSMVKDWKDSGLLDMHPDLIPNLKKDANGQLTIPYSAMMSLNTENSKMKSDAKTKAADDFQTKKNAADLTHLAAQTAQERASAAASGNEGALRAFELKQERAGADAETALTKNDGDWTKLSPDQKVALQPMVQKSIDEARAGLSDPLLKEQLGDLEHPDIQKVAQDRATALQQQLDDAKSHSIFVPPTGAPQIYVDPSTGTKYNLPPDQVGAFLKSHPQAQKIGEATSSPADVSKYRDLSPYDREKALLAVPPSQADTIRRALGVDVPDDSKYASDDIVQRQIKVQRGNTPDQIEQNLRDFDLDKGQLLAIMRGTSRPKEAP